ncbi:MAG: OmpA family protein [Bacteroidetes bacterium]|nr:OmpA family protein [Bacteroidota bacterium]
MQPIRLSISLILVFISGSISLQAQESKAPATDYKSYNNYDFVAGDKPIFEDDFRSDQDGEFPSHWDLQSGQAVVNKVKDEMAFSIIEGNYGKVFPRMKTKEYLPAEFTLECDHLLQSVNKAYGLVLFLVNNLGKEATLTFNDNNVTYTEQSKNLSSQLPDDIRAKSYLDKWNHLALVYRNNQMKVYVNQYRILVIPNLDIVPVAVKFGGIGSQKSPIIFTNVRIAEGGGMNMLQKLTTDGRIIVHGIKFDYNKAVIKPESMGILNEIARMLKDNSSDKYEIQGYTDSDGDDAYNLKLSQSRADAVKSMLVELGIDASRLKSTGYGESHPLTENTSPEGKATNRRVEFVKVK